MIFFIREEELTLYGEEVNRSKEVEDERNEAHEEYSVHVHAPEFVNDCNDYIVLMHFI